MSLTPTALPASTARAASVAVVDLAIAAAAVGGSLALVAHGASGVTHSGSGGLDLLESGTDSAVIALWLGHSNPQATQIYIRAHLAIKERALARTTPPNTTPGKFRPSDSLLAFLESL